MSIFQKVTFIYFFSFVWAQFYSGWPQVFGLIQHFNFQKSNRLSNQLSIQLLKKSKKFWIRHNLWLRNQYFKNFKSCFKLFYSPLLPIFIGLFFCYVKSYIYMFLHCIFSDACIRMQYHCISKISIFKFVFWKYQQRGKS